MVEYNRWGFRIFDQEWRAKMSRAKLGNENGAKPYPAFIRRDTGQVIPAGVNLSKMCKKRGICRKGMWLVARGHHYKQWEVYDENKQA